MCGYCQQRANDDIRGSGAPRKSGTKRDGRYKTKKAISDRFFRQRYQFQSSLRASGLPPGESKTAARPRNPPSPAIGNPRLAGRASTPWTRPGRASLEPANIRV